MPAPERIVTPLLRMRYRLEWAALRSAERVIPLLPLRLVRLAARAAGNLAWACDARGRRIIRENLRLALGRTHDGTARRRIERENYRLFARTFLELFWNSRVKAEEWDRYFVTAFDSPRAEEVVTGGRCIFATAHFGNFEWLSLGQALRFGTPAMIIAQDFKNPPLTAIFRRLRSRGGQIIISQEGAMLKLFRHLKKGGGAAALMDLNTPPDQSATVIRRFGMWSSVSVLHVALAARTGVPVVPALAIARADGRWELRFLEPIYVFTDTSLQQAAQQCWDSIEPVLRQHSEQWMWLYKHWRFLPPGADRSSYPAYANHSNRFKRLFVSTNGKPD